jgi:hypothetical protein
LRDFGSRASTLACLLQEMRPLLCLALAGCWSGGLDLAGTGTRRVDLDAAFHQDPRWLGGDGPARAASLYWPHVVELVLDHIAC